MLQRIDAPDNVLAFRAVGKIEKADYDSVLEPAVEGMIADKDELRFVYVLGDEFDSYTVGASWEDAKLGIGHVSKWKRIGIVTDHDWVGHLVAMFGWMVPGEMRIFPLEDEKVAINWASG